MKAKLRGFAIRLDEEFWRKRKPTGEPSMNTSKLFSEIFTNELL